MEPRKHSGLGIASFVMSLICGVSVAGILVILTLMAATHPQGIEEKSIPALLLGAALLGLCALSLLSLALGIGGLCQTDRNRIFAALGTTFSALVLLGTGGLVMLGVLVGP